MNWAEISVLRSSWCPKDRDTKKSVFDKKYKSGSSFPTSNKYPKIQCTIQILIYFASLLGDFILFFILLINIHILQKHLGLFTAFNTCSSKISPHVAQHKLKHSSLFFASLCLVFLLSSDDILYVLDATVYMKQYSFIWI